MCYCGDHFEWIGISKLNLWPCSMTLTPSPHRPAWGHVQHMSVKVSQITGKWTDCSTADLGLRQRKHQTFHTQRYYDAENVSMSSRHHPRLWYIHSMVMPLLFRASQWRHNGLDSVSNHLPHDCLLNRLFRRRSKKTSKLRVTGLCVGISPGTGEIPTQRVSIWWRHHGLTVWLAIDFHS